MSIIEVLAPYRYYETILAIVNGMVDSAFTACRYAIQPNESTEKYHERISLTSAIIYSTYCEDLHKALQGIVTTPEEPVQLTLEASIADDDFYENGMNLFAETLHKISKDLAVAAYELDINQINNYFKSLPQSEALRK